MSGNSLHREVSPYLLQHKDNPVDWLPWGPEAFARARAENRPILLSIGYAACHWCHVMAHESFENPETAAVMNRLFVNVKVDREERPDVDDVYMAALQALGQPGGWPLTMFLTPDGAPFWGGTYFPPEPRHGLPAFRDMLEQIATIYHDQAEDVRHNASAIGARLGRLAARRPGPVPSADTVAGAAARIAGVFDMERGGVRGAPKFPNAPLLALFDALASPGGPAIGRENGTEAARAALDRTLRRMAAGGIHDHLGGGFARYSVDADWLVPHFEKMLIDNAQLLPLYARAWTRAGSAPHAAVFAQAAQGIMAWLAREMETGDGAFTSSLDADSEGEEGLYYLWTAEEIAAVLGADDAALFGRVYDIRPGGNFEGRAIPNRLAHPDPLSGEDEARLEAMAARLHDRRWSRSHPGRDDKVLADWNGLMIAGLAEAGMIFDRPDQVARAARAFDAVLASHDRNGRLGHAARDGRLVWPGLLDDHAAMILAALALDQAEGGTARLARAEGWAEVVMRHHMAEGGGWHMTADDAEVLPVRSRPGTDAAQPSGNGLMAQALARLALATGNPAYAEAARATIAAFGAEVDGNPFGVASLMVAALLLETADQVVVVGPAGDEATRALLRAAAASGRPLLDLRRIEPGTPLPAGHPSYGKGMADGRPTAYHCRGPRCGLPLHDPAALAAALAPEPVRS
ncbi:thioredoxin domain-containing protein [Tistrella mobilis]|uniref:thioredoxin domain-containing protein n=1 Tax=Tistrella mobilis TaxID=171437 RepID=UPI003558B768